jgi:hypothetical protein
MMTVLLGVTFGAGHTAFSMAITNLDFETIGERDLDQLRLDQVAEGISLDYKRDAYDASDEGKRELLKDISSLVNTAGGHVVIGMDEVDGLPTELNRDKPRR